MRMFDLPQGVNGRLEVLALLLSTFPVLLPEDVQAVTGLSHPDEVLQVLQGLSREMDGADEAWLKDENWATEIQWLRFCGNVDASLHPLCDVVLGLRRCRGDAQHARQEIQALLKGCTWQQWLLLLEVQSSDVDGADLVQQIRWVITGAWLHAFGWIRWEDLLCGDASLRP